MTTTTTRYTNNTIKESLSITIMRNSLLLHHPSSMECYPMELLDYDYDNEQQQVDSSNEEIYWCWWDLLFMNPTISSRINGLMIEDDKPDNNHQEMKFMSKKQPLYPSVESVIMELSDDNDQQQDNKTYLSWWDLFMVPTISSSSRKGVSLIEDEPNSKELDFMTIS